MKKIWIAWIASVLLFSIASFVNARIFAVHNILNIEFARTNETLGDCIQEISQYAPDPYHRLFLNTVVDYGYLLAYTLVIIFSVIITLDALQLKPGKWIYAFCVLPGLMDSIENAYLIATAVKGQPAISWFYVTVVRIKWATAIPFYLLFVVVLIYGLILLFRANQTSPAPEGPAGNGNVTRTEPIWRMP